VFLCFIQVKALVVAFLAEFFSFVFRIVFASVIGRSKEWLREFVWGIVI
jgi:hypothetical protein